MLTLILTTTCLITVLAMGTSKRPHRMTVALLAASAFGVGLAVGIEQLLEPGGVIHKGPSEWWEDHALELASFFAMLLGILARSAIDALNRQGNLRLERRSLFKALILAPAVYQLLHDPGAVDAAPMTWMFFAFENGFLWHAIVDRHPAMKSTPAQASGSTLVTALTPSTNASPGSFVLDLATREEWKQLRALLASFFPKPDDARVLLSITDMKLEQIDFSGNAEILWERILDEASKHPVALQRQLLGEAYERYQNPYLEMLLKRL